MVRFGKKVAVLTLAGALAAMSVTGCGSIKERLEWQISMQDCSRGSMRLIMPE